MRIYRIKLNNNLLADFYLAQNKEMGNIIFLGGLPSYLHKSKFAEQLAMTGYNVIQPFYYGSWVSGGDFTARNCLKTVNDTIKKIQSGSVFDLYNKKDIKIDSKNIYLGGISFGTNIIQSFPQINEIKKRFLISAVPLFKDPYSKEIGIDGKRFTAFLKNGFPLVYRSNNWKEWEREFYGKGTILNKFLASEKEVKIFQGELDSISPQIITNYLKKESLNINIEIIKNAKHAIDEYDQAELAELVVEYLRKRD